MPPRKKTARTAAPPPAPKQNGNSRKIILVVLAVLALAGIVLSTGVLNRVTSGPKTPLPRLNLELGFGTDLKDVLAKFPGSKDRSFNNDPQFRILTLKDRKDMPAGASEAEIIFFQNKLYFTSAKWENDASAKVPVESWAHEYRRWKVKQPDSKLTVQGAGNDTLLREWYFNDGATEMVLRDLVFNGITNRWMDLRDASNRAAQEAFQQYRFDLQ